MGLSNKYEHAFEFLNHVCVLYTIIFSGWSRGGARGTRSPLFLDQNEVRRAEKIIFETGPPLIKGSEWPFQPPPPPLPLSEGLNPPLIFHTNFGPWVYVLGDKVLSYGTITGLKFLDRILCPFWTAWSLALPLSPPYWLLNFFLIRYEHLFPSAKLTLTD